MTRVQSQAQPKSKTPFLDVKKLIDEIENVQGYAEVKLSEKELELIKDTENPCEALEKLWKLKESEIFDAMYESEYQASYQLKKILKKSSMRQFRDMVYRWEDEIERDYEKGVCREEWRYRAVEFRKPKIVVKPRTIIEFDGRAIKVYAIFDAEEKKGDYYG